MSYARSFAGTPKEKKLVDNSEFLKLLVFTRVFYSNE